MRIDCLTEESLPVRHWEWGKGNMGEEERSITPFDRFVSLAYHVLGEPDPTPSIYVDTYANSV